MSSPKTPPPPSNQFSPSILQPTTPANPLAPFPTTHGPRLSSGIVAGIVIVAIAALALLSALYLIRRRRREKLVFATSPQARDSSQCVGEYEVGGEGSAKFEAEGQNCVPELRGKERVEVDAGGAAWEVIDGRTAAHEMP